VTDTAVDLIRSRLSSTPGLIADRSANIEVAAAGHRRMRALLDALGRPQLAYRTIHIAGSKGKGTTAWLIDAILRACGPSTGRFTSPHLEHWNERIAIDGVALADEPFARLLRTVLAMIELIERTEPEHGRFNAFELLTATAFMAFRERQIELGVIETGLGGRFDSTNHLNPLATVITRIEMEHVDILGPTLADIVWNKAGIVRPGIPVVLGRQVDEVRIALIGYAHEIGSPLAAAGEAWSIKADEREIHWSNGSHRMDFDSIALPGQANLDNLGCALTAVSLAGIDLGEHASAVRSVVAGISIPGRFEAVRIDRHDLILDVAHTAESIASTVANARDHFGRDQFPVVLAILEDKAAEEIVEILAPVAQPLILPTIDHARILPADSLQSIATLHGCHARIVLRAMAALDEIGRDDPALVTGSFAIVAAFRQLVGQNPARNPAYGRLRD